MSLDALSAALEERVMRGEAKTSVELRAKAARVARGEDAPDLDDALRAFLQKVGRHAYQVTADDLAALKRLGHTEDALFELTVSAALAAGRHRLARGLAALDGLPK